jgi:hypothetical protein
MNENSIIPACLVGSLIVGAILALTVPGSVLN